jgi:hypothetical protein
MNDKDFIVRDFGSVWTFEPVSETAKTFTNAELQVEGWQWVGKAFGVDHSVAQNLLTALEDEGFVVDFQP